MDNGLALLNHADLPHSFWSYAFAIAVFAYNHTVDSDGEALMKDYFHSLQMSRISRLLIV